VFELQLKRGLRGAGGSARCIFSGARGEVCTMEPLRVGLGSASGRAESLNRNYCFLVFALLKIWYEICYTVPYRNTILSNEKTSFLKNNLLKMKTEHYDVKRFCTLFVGEDYFA
jgi:hypothetical protein